MQLKHISLRKLNKLVGLYKMLGLKLGCDKPTPLTGISSQDSFRWLAKENRISCSHLFLSFPGSLSFCVMFPLYSAHLDYLVPGDSL